jgi:hypothetical protein
MRRSLFPLTALASARVWSRSYVQGSDALTTRGPSWPGDGVAMADCDEPAVSGVALPAGVAPPAMVAPPAAICVTVESKPVVVVSTVTRQARRPVGRCHPWSREWRRTQTHPRPAGPRRPCRKYYAEPGT